ncbi:MAG: hypothetical protein ACRC8D_05925 [Aeromonas sp.]
MPNLTAYDYELLALFLAEHWALFVNHLEHQTCEVMGESDADRIRYALEEITE